VHSQVTRKFWRLFSDLPLDVQRDAKRSYRVFQSNPRHPGLQFKKLEGDDNIYSARIGLGYHGLARLSMEIALFGTGLVVTPTTTGWLKHACRMERFGFLPRELSDWDDRAVD
jgi:hypothetical protein